MAEHINKPRLNALTGLKVLCLFGVFMQHFGFKFLGLQQPFDIGSRAVEVFFACSGILTAYNHGLSYEFSIAECFSSLTKKLRHVWPLHTVAFVLSTALAIIAGTNTLKPDFFPAVTLFLTMTEAWAARSILSTAEYPGALWFLSALAFCWLLTPAIAFVVKALAAKFGDKRRGGLVAFAAFTCIGCWLEWIVLSTKLLSINLHTAPVVRLFQYAAAYAVGVAFFDWVKDSRVARFRQGVKGVAEVAIVLFVAASFMEAFGEWPRTAHYMAAVLVVLTLAYEAGPISRVLSLGPFVIASRIELEFYAFHLIGIQLSRVFSPPTLAPEVVGLGQLVLAFISTCCLSVGWKFATNRAQRLFQGAKASRA